MRRSGYFYQFVPKRYGGLESGFEVFIDTGIAIAEADASTAWVATFCAEHNWIFSHFPTAAQQAVWKGAHPYIIAPGVTFPPGRAVSVEGGYRVSAHWKWGTGVMHADWIIGSVILRQDGGEPESLMVMLPAEQAKVLDVWFMDGMAATGSNDIVVDDLFIPEAFVARGMGRAGGARLHDNPIYGAPMLPFLAMTAAISAVGAARGMVRTYRDRLAGRVKLGSSSPESDKAPAHIRLAHADLLARSARSLCETWGASCRMRGGSTSPSRPRCGRRCARRSRLRLASVVRWRKC